MAVLHRFYCKPFPAIHDYFFVQSLIWMCSLVEYITNSMDPDQKCSLIVWLMVELVKNHVECIWWYAAKVISRWHVQDNNWNDKEIKLFLFWWISYTYWQSKYGITRFEGALTWYGKITWESAHAWNLIKVCYLIVWCTYHFIFMVHLSFYAIPLLLIYDVMNDITIIP